MAIDRFFIAPYDKNSGLRTDVKPWLIPDEAWATLQNAYVFRGRVRKRFGSRWLGDSQLLSRLRVNVGTTDISGNYGTATILSGTNISFVAGQLFSIGNEIITIIQQGSPATVITTGSSTFQFDTTTGTLTIAGAAANTDIYFYPTLPVMGLQTFETSNLNNEQLIGFDTKFAYLYNIVWDRLDGEVTPGAATWNGSDTDFFWTTTWTGTNAYDKVFFVTNFNAAEPNYMRFFFNNQWDNFRPAINGTDFLDSARILVPFKNRLIAFNTVENISGAQQAFQNRARYSQVGSPLDSSAWRQDIPGRGNAIDASTTEAITTVEFVQDRLIVYFEESTWEFVYTGNQAYPFVWQKINTELGAESTFSVIPFDKVALGVGNVGIHACNGLNVERIDDAIPDNVFEIHNTDGGIDRVYGIRDYYVEMVYWAFPNTDTNSTFPYPNRVLVYNYKTGTWALNDDSITCFGYFQPQSGVTWNSTTVTWDDTVSWNSGALQAQFRQVVAGNQQGYTFIIDADEPVNAPVLQITDIDISMFPTITFTVYNHNLRDGDYVYFQDIVATGTLTNINGQIFRVNADFADPDTFSIAYTPITPVLTGAYQGNGVISRVSNIDMRTKEFNFYAQSGRNAYISKIDFMVDRTDTGQIGVDFYVSTADNSMIADSGPDGTGCLLGTGVLETFAYPSVPFETTATRIWHPVYIQADGEVVQLQLHMTDDLMRNTDVRKSPFTLYALCIYATPTSNRFQ